MVLDPGLPKNGVSGKFDFLRERNVCAAGQMLQCRSGSRFEYGTAGFNFGNRDICGSEQGADVFYFFRRELCGASPLGAARARAALRPAIVLSRIKLRSNSARAAKTWKPAGQPKSALRFSR